MVKRPIDLRVTWKGFLGVFNKKLLSWKFLLKLWKFTILAKSFFKMTLANSALLKNFYNLNPLETHQDSGAFSREIWTIILRQSNWFWIQKSSDPRLRQEGSWNF